MEHLQVLQSQLSNNKDLVYVTLALTTLSLLLKWASKINQIEPGEPPLLPGALPLVGHAIAYLKDSNKVYERARDWSPTSHPVSLSIFGKRLYVVLNPKDISVAWRNKILSFDPIVLWAMSSIFGMTKDGAEKLRTDPDGQGDMFNNQHAYWRDALAPGDSLNEITSKFLSYLEQDMDNVLFALKTSSQNPSLPPSAIKLPSNSMSRVSLNTPDLKLGTSMGLQGGEMEVPLREWSRDRMGISSTNALIGTRLLKEEPDMFNMLAKWEKGFYKLAMNLPRWMNKDAEDNLEKMILAFEKWGLGEEDALSAMKRRGEMMKIRDLTNRDVAAGNFSFWTGTQTNANPSAFWLLYQILRHPECKAVIEKEIAGAFTKDENGVERLTNLDHLLYECPLLASMWWEVLRYTSGSASTREVEEDTKINGWIFKKNSMVFIPLRTGHVNPKTFGTDVSEFNPHRFLYDIQKNRVTKEEAIQAEEKLNNEIHTARAGKGVGPGYSIDNGYGKGEKGDKHPSIKNLKPFGGGVSLCPGRHFSTNEVYGFVACTLRKFDMELLEGQKEAKPATSEPVVAAYPPDRRVWVRIRARV